MSGTNEKYGRLAIIVILVSAALLVAASSGCGEEKPAGDTVSTATTTTLTTPTVAPTTPTVTTSGTVPTETTPLTLAEKQRRGRLVMEEKCFGCHSIAGQGASGPGPDLTHESAPPPPDATGLLDYREFYSRWLDDPKFYAPWVTMPIIPLTPEEKENVIEYLLTLT